MRFGKGRVEADQLLVFEDGFVDAVVPAKRERVAKPRRDVLRRGRQGLSIGVNGCRELAALLEHVGELEPRFEKRRVELEGGLQRTAGLDEVPLALVGARLHVVGGNELRVELQGPTRHRLGLFGVEAIPERFQERIPRVFGSKALRFLDGGLHVHHLVGVIGGPGERLKRLHAAGRAGLGRFGGALDLGELLRRRTVAQVGLPPQRLRELGLELGGRALIERALRELLSIAVDRARRPCRRVRAFGSGRDRRRLASRDEALGTKALHDLSEGRGHFSDVPLGNPIREAEEGLSEGRHDLGHEVLATFLPVARGQASRRAPLPVPRRTRRTALFGERCIDALAEPLELHLQKIWAKARR